MENSHAKKIKRLKQKKQAFTGLFILLIITIIRDGGNANAVSQIQWFMSLIYLACYIDYRTYKLKIDLLDKIIN